MSHLLAISVGPVQEFIAAARRTRDLWFGSHLLSEISRAVAKSIEAEGGKLIFPESSDAENVANVILAEVASGDPKAISAKAKQATQECWMKYVNEAEKEASGVIRFNIWKEQVHDVTEFYAAWVERTDDYSADRRRLMRLLAGRKNCRDFLAAHGHAGVPKSSLDGRRESVLKHPKDWPDRFRAKLRIRDGEQLDVVGMVKRIAGGKRPYPSVARIAADSWVRENMEASAFSEVVDTCRNLGTSIVHRLTDFSQFKAFSFEGTAVYPSRHHEWIEETSATVERLKPLQNALRKLPDPDPYLAVLVADGDKMGESISRLKSPDEHREFSKTLSEFATQAKSIVEKDHHGCLVYAGGDDVLAFVPVHSALPCARALHDQFGETMKAYSDEQGQSPTFSVGLAVGHFMENLETLLNYGRAAERNAKQPDRDGLAVHLHKRSGAPILVREQWNTRLDERLIGFAQLLDEGGIPSGLPYELRSMATLYESWPNGTPEEKKTLADAIRLDVLRVLGKKQLRIGSIQDRFSSYLDGLTPGKLLQLAEQILVARQIVRNTHSLNDATRQSVPVEVTS